MRGRDRSRGGRRGGSRGARGGSRGARGGSRGGRGGGNVEESGGNVGNNEVVNFEEEMQKFFLSTVSMDLHLEAQEKHRSKYIAALCIMKQSGVEISQNARVRSLAACWARNDRQLSSWLLSDRKATTIVEVLKACQLLDAGRQLRVAERKLRKLQSSQKKCKPKTIGRLKSEIHNLASLKPAKGALNGCTCKVVARWVRAFSKEELEFFSVHFPAEPWKQLADLCHLNPKKEFAALPWFLPYCFGEPAPANTIASNCKTLDSNSFNELIREYDIPYSHVRTAKVTMTDESKARIAEYEKLDTLLWYYEELHNRQVDQIIDDRMVNGEKVTLPYGKLMERLLMFKLMQQGLYRDPNKTQRYGYGSIKKEPDIAPFFERLMPQAEESLKKISLKLESPIVVIGDKSASMDVAIQTSTIIASLLTAICSAKLTFFNRDDHVVQPPSNVREVLEMACTIKAEGGTSPAVSLYPFVKNKEVVKTFILVTDEEENGGINPTTGKSMPWGTSTQDEVRFAELYKLYHDEVYPAKLVFVSFKNSQIASGQMMESLAKIDGITRPLNFSFLTSRPDLTKLDNMFGQLSGEAASFEKDVMSVAARLETDGGANVLAEF